MKKRYPYRWWCYLDYLHKKDPLMIFMAITNSMLVFTSSLISFTFNLNESLIVTGISVFCSLLCFWALKRNLKYMRRINISKLKILALTNRIKKRKQEYLLKSVCEVVDL